MKLKSLVSGLALTGVALLGPATLPAHAQVTSTGPFTGSASETWESFPNYFSVWPISNPTTIFGGLAQISNGAMLIYEPSAGATWGLGSSGPAQVSDGQKGLGINGGGQTTTITFSNPVSAFGGYWGAATDFNFPNPNTVTLSFFDVFAEIIDTEQFTYSHSDTGNGQLDWHGWSSSTPIAQITYQGDYVVNDGLQANTVSTVPEPASLSLLLLGGVPLARKLRRRNTEA